MRKIGALWNPNTKFSFWMLSLLLTVILMGIPFTWAEAQVEIITLISIHQIPFVILIHRQNRFSFGVLYPGWNWCEWIQIFASGTGYGGFICRGLFGVKPYTYRFFHEGHHGEWKKIGEEKLPNVSLSIRWSDSGRFTTKKPKEESWDFRDSFLPNWTLLREK